MAPSNTLAEDSETRCPPSSPEEEDIVVLGVDDDSEEEVEYDFVDDLEYYEELVGEEMELGSEDEIEMMMQELMVHVSGVYHPDGDVNVAGVVNFAGVLNIAGKIDAAGVATVAGLDNAEGGDKEEDNNNAEGVDNGEEVNNAEGVFKVNEQWCLNVDGLRLKLSEYTTPERSITYAAALRKYCSKIFDTTGHEVPLMKQVKEDCEYLQKLIPMSDEDFQNDNSVRRVFPRGIRMPIQVEIVFIIIQISESMLTVQQELKQLSNGV